MSECIIYGLKRTGVDQRVRYVGHSIDPTRRLRQHLSNARIRQQFPVEQWIREVGEENVELVELEVCPREHRLAYEAWWIRELRTLAELGEGGLNDSHAARTSRRTADLISRIKRDPALRDARNAEFQRPGVDPAEALRSRWVKTPERMREIAAKAGRRSGHVRWHVSRGVVSSACEFCAAA